MECNTTYLLPTYLPTYLPTCPKTGWFTYYNMDHQSVFLLLTLMTIVRLPIIHQYVFAQTLIHTPRFGGHTHTL